MLKDCHAQVEVTSNTSTIGGRENLQQRLTTCDQSVKEILDGLQLVQQKTSLTDELSHLSTEVSDWLAQSKLRLAECSAPWNTEADIEAKVSELEVSCRFRIETELLLELGENPVDKFKISNSFVLYIIGFESS